MDKINIKSIKSKYILRVTFDYLQQNKFLELIKYNKSIQNILDINKASYKEYKQLEIEVIPGNIQCESKIINIIFEKDKPYYHIYFDDNKEEKKEYLINEKDQVQKIKVIIDYEVKSLPCLFKDCRFIKKINIIKCHRKDLEDINSMFCGCSSLIELNLANLNTDKVTDISWIFYECSLLKEIKLPNFNTNNVTKMDGIFQKCSSLKEINLSNFNIDKVTE